MSVILLGIPAGLLMIGVLVVVHEFGHYLAARMFGIGAPVFSVGVGNRLWGFDWNGTDFRLSSLPLGGYVQLAGVDPFGDEDIETSMVDPAENFLARPVWQRLVVMAAGPGFNLLLPIPVFAVMFMLGDMSYDNVVGTVVAGSPAAEAGFEDGDRVTGLAGRPVKAWVDWQRITRSLPHEAVEVPHRVARVTQVAAAQAD